MSAAIRVRLTVRLWRLTKVTPKLARKVTLVAKPEPIRDVNQRHRRIADGFGRFRDPDSVDELSGSHVKIPFKLSLKGPH